MLASMFIGRAITPDGSKIRSESWPGAGLGAFSCEVRSG